MKPIQKHKFRYYTQAHWLYVIQDGEEIELDIWAAKDLKKVLTKFIREKKEKK